MSSNSDYVLPVYTVNYIGGTIDFFTKSTGYINFGPMFGGLFICASPVLIPVCVVADVCILCSLPFQWIRNKLKK
jgi:hypothetical protein